MHSELTIHHRHRLSVSKAYLLSTSYPRQQHATMRMTATVINRNARVFFAHTEQHFLQPRSYNQFRQQKRPPYQHFHSSTPIIFIEASSDSSKKIWPKILLSKIVSISARWACSSSVCYHQCIHPYPSSTPRPLRHSALHSMVYILTLFFFLPGCR